MAKLSIVIPVYNTLDEFLEECLNKIFDSTLKDIEVIVVDDGSSKDYSKLQKKFLRKIKYIKTENQGTLKARLFGAKQATSPYVAYVDSDDTISFDYLEATLTKIEKENADICLNDWAFETEQTKYVCGNDTTINKDIIYEGDLPIRKFFLQAGKEHSFYVLWNKIFKKEILDYAAEEIEKLGFDKLVFAEDVLICFFAFKKAQKVVNTHLGYYFYRIHGMQQISVNEKSKLQNHVESMTKVFDVMENNMTESEVFEDVKPFFDMWKNMLCTNNYKVAKRSGYKDLLGLIKEKYRISKVKKLPRGHSKAYENQRVLPLNIDSIDTQLKKVYYSNRYLKVYAKRNSYAFESLVSMKRLFNLKFDLVKSKKQATFVFDKEKVSIKQRILHNDFVYKLGVLLFPKGSKMRKFLKSKL